MGLAFCVQLNQAIVQLGFAFQKCPNSHGLFPHWQQNKQHFTLAPNERAFPLQTQPPFPGCLSGRKTHFSGDLSLRRTSYLDNIFIILCKRSNISKHFSLFSDRWAIYKAYPQSLPCEQLALKISHFGTQSAHSCSSASFSSKRKAPE